MRKQYLSAFTKAPVLAAALFIALALPFVSLPEPGKALTSPQDGTRCHNWGTPEYNGSSWMTNDGGGVEVYSNGSTIDLKDCSGNIVSTYAAACKNSVNGVTSGAEWQCVELFNRLYLTKGWISSTWTGNGNQLYNATLPTGFHEEDNTHTTYINPGDAITFDDGGSGHVVMVDSVSGSTVNVVSQNTKGVTWTVSWNTSTNTLTQTYLGSTYTVQAIIHRPNSNPIPPPDIRVPVVGDFTGDHHDDLLGSSKRSDPAPNLLVFPSTGSWLGGSSLWGAPSAISWANAKLTVGDLDGDGKSDLFAVQLDANGNNPDIYWLQSTGSSFATPQLVGVPVLAFNDVKEWVSGDFTGDGHADLLAVSKRADAAPNLIVFPSTGAWLGGSQLWSAPSGINWSTAVIVPADVNGDGKTDLLAIQPDSSGYADIYYSQSLGSSFAAPVLTQATNIQFGDVSAWEGGGFNGDGYKDLVAIGKRSDSAPNIMVFPSNGSGLNSSQLWSAPGNISYANAVWVPGDLDGDGKTDLFAIQTDANGVNPDIYWIQSQGSSFATPQLVGVPGLTNSNVHWQR